jgi:hypothetical protein
MTNVRIAKTESLDREIGSLLAPFVIQCLGIERIVAPRENAFPTIR